MDGLRGILQVHRHLLVMVLEAILLVNVAGSPGLCIFILVTISERIYRRVERLPVKDFLVWVGVFHGLFGVLKHRPMFLSQ